MDATAACSRRRGLYVCQIWQWLLLGTLRKLHCEMVLPGQVLVGVRVQGRGTQTLAWADLGWD